MTTNINKEALLSLGYKEFPPNRAFDSCEAMFQKRVRDDVGTLYFINFRYWKHNEHESWDAQLHCETSSDGYLWATVKEPAIEQTQARIRSLWEAAGSKRYDN